MPARLGLWLGLLACFVAAALSDVVSVGLQLPFEDPVRCVTAWQYFHIARVAARFIESSPEWAAKAGAGTSLRLEVLPSADSYQAWQSSVKYALEPEPTCGKNCRVFRAGIVGPFSLEGTQLVSLVTRMAGMMHVPYGAVDEALTIDATSPLALSAANGEVVLPPFFRASHTDSMEVGALYSFIQSSGWRIFTVVHTREQHSSDSATLLADVAQHSSEFEIFLLVPLMAPAFVPVALTFSSSLFCPCALCFLPSFRAQLQTPRLLFGRRSPTSLPTPLPLLAP